MKLRDLLKVIPQFQDVELNGKIYKPIEITTDFDTEVYYITALDGVLKIFLRDQ